MNQNNSAKKSALRSGVDRIGVMFGSFNPPHLGHVETARQGKIISGASEVLLVPIMSYFKRKLSQATHSDKVAMCELLTRDDRSWLKVSRDFEGQEPTLASSLSNYFRFMSGLSKKHPEKEIVIICGSDNIQKIAKLCSLFNVVNTAKNTLSLSGAFNDAAQNRKIKMVCLPRSDYFGTHGQVLAPSSTSIRKALEEGAADSLPWMSPVVHDYIKNRQLYASPD